MPQKGNYLSRIPHDFGGIPHDFGGIPHDFAYTVKQKGFF